MLRPLPAATSGELRISTGGRGSRAKPAADERGIGMNLLLTAEGGGKASGPQTAPRAGLRPPVNLVNLGSGEKSPRTDPNCPIFCPPS